MLVVKRIVACFLVLLGLIMLVPGGINAEEYDPEIISGQCGDNIIWELNTEEGGYTLSLAGEGEMWNYLDLQTLSVDEIGELPPWFESRYEITKIVLSEGITRIGSGAFYYCRNLQILELPDTLQSIGDFAFVGCTALEEISLPDDIVEISPRAFAACSGLEHVDLPANLLFLGEFAFCTCTNLSDMILPENLQEISDGTFADCFSLTEIIIPDSVYSIGLSAFSGCEGLEYIELPASLSNDLHNVANVPAMTVDDVSPLMTYLNSTAAAIKNNVDVIHVDGNSFTACGQLLAAGIHALTNSNTNNGLAVFTSAGGDEVAARSIAGADIMTAGDRIGERVNDYLKYKQEVTNITVYTHQSTLDWADGNSVFDFKKAYFDPSKICDRVSFLLMLWNYSGRPSGTGSFPSNYTSYATNSDEYKAIKWAYQNGYISGTAYTPTLLRKQYYIYHVI